MTSEERKQARYERRKKKRERKQLEKMKEIDDFDKIFSFNNIYDSFSECKKGISWKGSVKSYNINRLKYSYKAYTSLKDYSYKFKGFVEFSIYERGKKRNIKSIHISDRVIQKCLCNSIVPALSNSFIYDNGASLKGKGTSKAMDRFKCMLDRHYRKYGNEGYALLIDDSSYFERLMHATIKNKLFETYHDKKIIGLSIMYLNKENELSGRGQGIGLSLGCQPNQIYAVGYQNEIDHFAKEKLKLKAYIRYMDDTVILHRSKNYLKKCLEKIKEMCKEIGIVLNPKKTQIVKIKKGVKFLKTMHYLTETGKIIRKPWKKSVVRMRRKLKKFKNMLEDGQMSFSDIRTSYGSWRGYIKKFNSYRTIRSMDILFNQLFTTDWISKGGISCV